MKRNSIRCPIDQLEMTRQPPHGLLAEPHGFAGVYIPRYIQGMYGLRFTRTAETPYGASPTGSPPLSGYARLAWFPDGYRVSIFPYRSALRPNPASRAHRPRYSAFPTAVGHWLTKGRRFASLRVRRRSSPPWQEGNHAPQCGRVHLSCRARSVTTRRFAGVPPDLQARV